MKLIKGLKSGTRKKATAALTEPAKSVEKPAKRNGGAKAVTIEAKIDVGFGNSLFLRGEGKGLSWEHGLPLTCVDGSTWKWSGEVSDELKFKLLLNDAVWATGEDLVAIPGQKIEISPVFS